MMIGNPSNWLKRIKDIDNLLIQNVVKVWPDVITKFNKNSIEDHITQRLVDLLRKDRTVIKYGFLDCQFKLREEDVKGDFTTKGILDMVLFLDQDHERYIAYECKRLNTISNDGSRSSLAGKYAEEGIMRYVTAQYAENLPFGCMIGYVMDGDTEFAIKQLETAIGNREKLLKLSCTEIDIKHGSYAQFETSHERSDGKSQIEVRHRLFSM
ncbi:MAG: hypothetical protein ACPHLK_06080 [Gammaproteobacteria bacterium]|jgi:hypothetical protein